MRTPRLILLNIATARVEHDQWIEKIAGMTLHIRRGSFVVV
jgi:hypothetical protein